MKHADFEARVQDCCDRRTDPLADAQVKAFLLDHPEALEEFAERRALLRALPSLARARRRRWPWAVAAAIAVTAAALGWPAHASGGRGRILEARLTERCAAAGAAFHWQAREVLVNDANTRLEIVEQWSRPR